MPHCGKNGGNFEWKSEKLANHARFETESEGSDLSKKASFRRDTAATDQKKAPSECSGLLELKSGGDLLSHTENRAVPSAQRGLTTEFGMGSGVTPSL